MIGFKGRGFLVYPRLDRPGVPVQNTNIFPLRDNGLPIELPQDQSYRFAAIFDRIAATGIEAGMTTIWPDRVSVCPTVVDHAIKCTDFSAYQRRDSSSLPILPDGDWQPMAAGEADPCNGRGGQFSIVSEQSLAGRSLVLFSEPKDRLLASVSNRRGGPLHGVAAHWQDGTCRVYAASDNEGHDDLPTMLYEFELKPDR
jgi:hypothetical protein